MPVTIKSDGASGQVEITLDKTGADKGTIRVKTATKNDLTKLYDVKAGDGGSKVVCRGDVFGTDPTITCTLSKPPNAPSVRVTIKGTLAGLGDGTTDYAVPQADLDALRDFIATAGFPSLS